MILRYGFPMARAIFIVAVLAIPYLVQASNVTYTAPGGRKATVNDAFLWGPYKPNLYFGVRPRLPKSLTTGLLWTNVNDYQSAQQNFRFTCEQNEGMSGYGWDEYDLRTGGRQTIHDTRNYIDITTEFVKIPGGTNGGSWGARIKGQLRDDAPEDLKTSVVFYAAMEEASQDDLEEEEARFLHIINPHDPLGYEGSVVMRGHTQELGHFQLEVTRGPDSNTYPAPEHPSYEEKRLDRTLATSGVIPEEHIWQAKPILFQTIKTSIDEYLKTYGEDNLPPPCQLFTIPNVGVGAGNLHLVQKIFQGSFEFDIMYTSASGHEILTTERITSAITAASENFNNRYSKVFAAKAPYDKPKYDLFSKSLFSNLLGGIGYWHGDHLVDRSYASEYDEETEGFWEDAATARELHQEKLEGPYELVSAIPSRTFFPRGFLWDEGFHLLPIIEWDPDLAVDIVHSWFNLMDENGWIAREQILGPEARSKVPQEFQTQYPHYANPPTLFLTIEVFLDKLASGELSSEKQESYTKSIRTLYPLLKRHYNWYRKTQSGDLKTYEREAFSSKEGYRWRGRTPRHILTSGLDDYPRAQPPHPGELHVDLMSWMGLMTRSMRRIATNLGETSDAATFATNEEAILRNLDDLHWDEQSQCYCDATIDAWEETTRVCHKGYISIFPFMTGMVSPSSPRLGALLDLLSDPRELWSPHGIRSLSAADPLYGTAENYWRSPVWMNMNYMVIDNLLKVARADASPHRAQAVDLYTKLRRNLVDTVYESWRDTGFAWEQYNPETGAGQRTQHFTGWTSLIVKILGMPDLEDEGELGEGKEAGRSHEEL